MLDVASIGKSFSEKISSPLSVINEHIKFSYKNVMYGIENDKLDTNIIILIADIGKLPTSRSELQQKIYAYAAENCSSESCFGCGSISKEADSFIIQRFIKKDDYGLDVKKLVDKFIERVDLYLSAIN